MRYYRPNDEIYFFGFSRGAYTARFLAEMIDHVGLLSQGNEELIRFAWKTFQRWQCRSERTERGRKEKKDLLEFMCAFRETFSRPVRPIQFLGLFDTVNSVPQFENALMSRNKFPYTARSTARFIRHAVSINERRAKFRQDLISQKPKHNRAHYRANAKANEVKVNGAKDGQGRQARPLSAGTSEGLTVPETTRLLGNPEGNKLDRGRALTLNVPERFRDPSETSGVRSLSQARSAFTSTDTASNESLRAIRKANVSEEDDEQDIQEVWFAGCHAVRHSCRGGYFHVTDAQHRILEAVGR
jgi:uncharacterized protein (DUF2235 family)